MIYAWLTQPLPVPQSCSARGRIRLREKYKNILNEIPRAKSKKRSTETLPLPRRGEVWKQRLINSNEAKSLNADQRWGGAKRKVNETHHWWHLNSTCNLYLYYSNEYAEEKHELWGGFECTQLREERGKKLVFQIYLIWQLENLLQVFEILEGK